MNIETKAFGTYTINSKHILSFPHGIFGFTYERNFVLINSKKPPFYWLQSTITANSAFIVISPFFFRPDYTINVNKAIYEELAISHNYEYLYPLTIVRIPKDNPSAMTANLRAPILINTNTQCGCQALQNDEKWQIRHNILQEITEYPIESVIC